MIRHRSILYGLFFLSGTAGLVYEILWMRYFQLLFGNTAKAAATVLTVFFLGMAIGSALGGRWAQRAKNPLRAYGWVELGIALAAAPVPLLPSLYERLLPASFFFDASFSLDLLRFLLALAMTLPAGILLGATFPIMGAALIKDRDPLGRSASLLYSLNTLGAVCGVALTGFFLPPAIGISLTYALAVAVNLLLGGWVVGGSGKDNPIPSSLKPTESRAARAENTSQAALSDRVLLALAFGSGMVLIGLEVLWTRMFALIFQNSVYSFSAILLTVLIGLSAGALFVGRVAPNAARPMTFLGATLGLAAFSTLLIPFLFLKTTGITYFAYGAGWPSYLYQVILLIAVIIFLPSLLAGMTLPLLWQLFHRQGRAVGASLGTVNFWNLLGGIVGATGAGFFLMPAFGLWTSVVIMAMMLLGLSQIALWSTSSAWRWQSAAVFLFVVAALFVSNPSRYPVQYLNDGEKLLYLDEGEDAVVSVVEDAAGVRWLKSNNTYRLGATTEVRGEKRLGHLPLLLHPDPKSAAFVGVGTGISMSAALGHPLERLVGVEILPGVLDAIPYFSGQNGDLLSDPRVKIALGDGRVYLRTTDQRFDVIISDLFVPWHAGTGSLYTLEHFQAGRERLNRGGLFVQWLPLYQMSERELGSIAATFAAVFPHVSIWRGDFSTTAPIIGLAGSVEPLTLDEGALGGRLAILADRIKPQDTILQTLSDFTLLYAGDLASVRAWLERFPLNTDDSPVVEFMAPVSQSRKEMVSGPALLSFYRRIQESPAVNPVRVRPMNGADAAPLSPLAGNLLFVAMEAAREKNDKAQLALINRAVELLPGSNVLNLMNVVLNATSATATRGVALDSLK
ncbi:MAG: fused MFS/spermidine synthase [Candidatus Manganitrophus sp.]|nr:fused MFS/spermidine synthase [Candidatus Manganitrophus sp.]